MKRSLSNLALGAALALVGATALAQPPQAQPIPSSVMDPSPVGDWPTPDNFAIGTLFVDRCESDHCAAVLLSRDFDFPGEPGSFAGALWIAATTRAQWPSRYDPVQLVAAVYEGGERIASDSREVAFPGLVYEASVTDEEAPFASAPLSDTDWIEEVFLGGRAPVTAPGKGGAASDLEGADYAGGSEIADFGNPHDVPQGRQPDPAEPDGAVAGQGAVADFIGQDYVVSSPVADNSINGLFEADAAAFAGGEAPSTLGQAFIREPGFDPGDSGRIGVLVLAPRAVRGAQPVIAPDGGFQSFGILVRLGPRDRY